MRTIALLVCAALPIASASSALETVWGRANSAGIVEQNNAGLPDGPNFVINSDYAIMLNPDQYRSSVILSPANSSQPNYIRNPDGMPVTPHPDLGLVTHTTTGDTDDTGNEICADVSINTYGYGACVGVDADQDYTGDPADIEEACTTDLNSGGNQTVNVYCGAGAIVTEPSYSSIVSGYDNHINHQAGTVAAQHSYIGPGDAGGHATILGGAVHAVEGDCEYGSIFGGSNNFLDCLQTSTTTSKSNSIFGGNDNRIDNDGETYAFDSSYNGIFSSLSSTINGASTGGVVIGGVRSGIMITDGLGSETVGDEARNNIVSGTGSAVFSFDPGDGTEVAPSYAEASGYGGRAWQSGMRCYGVANAGDLAEGAITGLDGSLGASAQHCHVAFTGNSISPGSYSQLTLDRGSSERFVVMDDGVFSIDVDILCQERASASPNRNFARFEVSGLLTVNGSGSGSGTASFYDSSGVSQSTIAATKTGYRALSGSFILDARLAARAGSGSLNAGFDIEVQPTGGSTYECTADAEILVLRDW